MMYNENKKVNKTLLIIVSCILFISSVLCFCPSWLAKYYDDTLCATQSAPIFDSTYFDYSDPNFITKFDFACEQLRAYSASSTYYSMYSIVPLNNVDLSFFPTTSTGYLGLNTQVYYYGPPQSFDSSNYGSVFDYYYYSIKSLRYTYLTSYNYYANLFYTYDIDDLLWLTDLDFVYSFSYEDTYYVGMSNSLYFKYLAYTNGVNAGSAPAYNNGYTNGYNAGVTDGYNNGVTTGQNNVINNPNNYGLFDQTDMDAEFSRGYQIGQDDILVDPNSYGLYTQWQYDNNYTAGYNAGVAVGQSNVINNPNDFGLFNQADMDAEFNRGYQDGQQSSTNYLDGYSAGQNEVINNPNDFGLFNQADMDAEFNRGYQDGISYATELYNGYGNFTYSKFYWTSMADKYMPLSYADTSYILSGNFSDFKQFFTKLDGGFQISSDYVDMILELDGLFSDGNGLSLDYSILWFEFFNGVSIAEFPTIVVPQGQNLGNTYYVELSDGQILEFNGADTIFNGIDLSSYTGYIVRVGIGSVNIQDYFSVGDGLAFNTADSISYQSGYNDGFYYGNNTGYTTGYNTGYTTGKSDGINSASDFGFYTLISSVVDAPINMFKSLFNFDIFGINLFSFFTSLFTLCLVIFIFTKILKR